MIGRTNTPAVTAIVESWMGLGHRRAGLNCRGGRPRPLWGGACGARVLTIGHATGGCSTQREEGAALVAQVRSAIDHMTGGCNGHMRRGR